jgi:hypothetical protein
MKAQHVVSSAPQPTTEGFSMPDIPDFAAELANLISRAFEAGADVDEVKAVLTEALEDVEAGANGAEEPPEDETA